MGLYEIGSILAVLSASRLIEWSEQVYASMLGTAGVGNGAPATANAGIDLQNVIKCLVSVQAREQAHRRTARYTVPVHDAATTYGAIIGVTTVTHVAGGDTRADQAIRGLVVVINASVPIQAIATAIAINAAGVDVTSTTYDGTDSATILATAATEVLIRGVNESNYTVDHSVAGGAGTSALSADAITCSMRVWITRKVSTGISEWVLVNDGKEYIDQRGWTERLTVNGYRRLYVEVYDCAGDGDGSSVTYAPTVYVGPALLES